ncbi:hypothetical protein ACSL103130_06905 [Actinomyces slackii]|uniref:Uncharacterized protein n=1 Tax=Actinomyces slackii TaxID=52774 RepID=A0A448K9B3_9ACTO|nr:Uncharacterised protein [Actinomyces slackii]
MRERAAGVSTAARRREGPEPEAGSGHFSGHCEPNRIG